MGTFGRCVQTYPTVRSNGLTVVLLAVTACTDAGTGRAAPPYQPSGGDPSDGAETLDVEPLGTTTFPGEGEEEGDDEGFACGPEAVQACPCPDGPGEGVQSCEDGLWGPCLCDEPATTDGGGDSSGAPDQDDGAMDSTGEPSLPTEVCYPGADNQYTTCLELHPFDPEAPPEGYAYGDALGGDPNYRPPVAFLDLDAEDPDLALAPNFTLGEFAQAAKGRWAIVQPHAVESIQALRDAVGPLGVNSGFRSPDYNAGIGGAGYSRHMYGDGFDFDPVDVSLAVLEGQCEAGGGMLVEYETHVHCDWRFDDVDEAFFGPANAAAIGEPHLIGAMHHEGRVYWATDEGFDEGEPVRRWSAWDSEGRELVTAARGPVFMAPHDAVRVLVSIGGAVTRESGRLAGGATNIDPSSPR